MSELAPRSRRPSAAYLIGWDCPSVEVPGWAADWLLRRTNFEDRRRAAAGDDPAVDEVLRAIRIVALRWQGIGSAEGSECGTPPVAASDPQPVLDVLGCTEAARLAEVTDRAIRKAINEGRLPAEVVGGRHLIQRTDIEAYIAKRRRAA